MTIPKRVLHDPLPTRPGVYIMKDRRGRVIYIGKASSLRSRVRAYWSIQEQKSRPQVKSLIREVAKIECQRTDSVLEALILEANLIKKYEPKYNIIQKDDKSFLFLAITKDLFPRPMLVRGNELAKVGEKHYKKIFGPYTSPSALRAALKLIRRIFPWSACTPPEARRAGIYLPAGRQVPSHVRGGVKTPPYKTGVGRPCFDHHLGLCPGVCLGAIGRADYGKTIRGLILFFEGKKSQILRGLKSDMRRASREERFEDAESLRRKVFSLEHIQDVAVLTREESPYFGLPRLASGKAGKPKPEASAINVFGRVEGYDVSNLPAGKAGISGTSAVGSMVVFQDGEPAKSQYRKFRIKTVRGANDYAMLGEVLRRRFRSHVLPSKARNLVFKNKFLHPSGIQDYMRGWPLPDLILIDGGWGQVNVAKQMLAEKHLLIPVVGIAKGFDRKQDRLIYPRENLELARVVELYKRLLQHVRDEAHRFAIAYHRKVRRAGF